MFCTKALLTFSSWFRIIFPVRTAPSSRYGLDTVRFVCKIRHLFHTAQTLSKKITEKLSFFFVFKVINVKYLSSTTFSLSMCTKFATEGNKTGRQAINQNRIICFVYLIFVEFIYFTHQSKSTSASRIVTTGKTERRTKNPVPRWRKSVQYERKWAKGTKKGGISVVPYRYSALVIQRYNKTARFANSV